MICQCVTADFHERAQICGEFGGILIPPFGRFFEPLHDDTREEERKISETLSGLLNGL